MRTDKDGNTMMDAEERTKQRNAERIEDDGMALHMVLMAAAMSSGEKPGVADKSAAQAVELLKARFT